MSDGPPTPSQPLTPSPLNPLPQVSTRRKSAHPTFHFASGLLSGISSAVLLQPADLLKTRVQQSPNHTLLPVLRSILSGPHPARTLWRGTVPSALRTGFGSALYFTSLNTLRQVVANYNSPQTTSRSSDAGARASTALPKLTSTQNLLTGATARTLAGLILMPMTVIKVRYESDLYAYKSISSAARSIFSTEGLRGFFAGFGATAIRDAPYAGLYVVFYEGAKTWLGGWTYSNNKGNGGQGDGKRGSGSGMGAAAGVNAASGVFAAGVATALTNPFDAVKTRLQLMPGRYGNMLRATAVMWREGGVRGFFDGLGLRMGRKAVSSALAWTVYEELVRQAERRLLDDKVM